MHLQWLRIKMFSEKRKIQDNVVVFQYFIQFWLKFNNYLTVNSMVFFNHG